MQENDVARVQFYLKKYGYLVPAKPSVFGVHKENAVPLDGIKPGFFDENTRRALLQFQEFAGLPATGEIDEAVLTQIEKPRCGFPDVTTFELKSMNAPNLGRWNHTYLTYAFQE